MDQNDNRLGPTRIRLSRDDLRIPIENAVSAFIGRAWKVSDARDMSEFACHPCALLSDGEFSVFAKYGDNTDSSAQFHIELEGLRFLTEKTGILTPAAIGIVPAGEGAVLIFERIEDVPKQPRHWAQIGKILARIHQNKADTFGFPTNGFIGPLPQDNTPGTEWHTFFGERRLWPHFRSAIASGYLPSALIVDIESILARLPELCGPEVQPALLHGDAQQNNFLAARDSVYVIDPAVHYGHPEFDLAMVECWQPAPQDYLHSYREEMPLDPGFAERQDLWRIPYYLAGVALEGPCHLDRLTRAVKKYTWESPVFYPPCNHNTW